MAYGMSDNIFTAVIDENGDIYDASTGRKRQKVGIDAQREQELLQEMDEMKIVLDNYYEKLVELGEIKPPKTAEQIALEQAAAQSEINQMLLKTMQEMQLQIKGLSENGYVGNGNGAGGEPIGETGAGARQVGNGSKKRNGAGEKDVTPNNE